jgi:UDP-GlcNAc:undecaprenyl-phosphate/decaprenyl-phosphate GlcNAc-1-phosphate transferase
METHEIFFSLSILTSFLASIFGSKISFFVAKKYSILDSASSAPERKSQKTPIPLIGGLSFFVSTTLIMGLIWLVLKWNIFELSGILNQNLFFPFHLFWIIIGSIIIFVTGCLDDKLILKPRYYFSLIFLGLFVTIFFGGLKIESLGAPFNQLNLNTGFLPQVLAFIWIGACLSATKFLDGHDGLVTSVGIIGFLTIAANATLPQVNQPLITLFALIWAAGLAGFLPNNFPNAKQYLGDGGSTIIGLMLGVFSILSGAKVATVSSVIGWFIADIFLIMIFRIFKYKSFKGVFKGDSHMHWHHRLRNLKFNKIQVLAITNLLVIFTSIVSLNFQTQNKIWIIVFQIFFIFTALLLSYKK